MLKELIVLSAKAKGQPIPVPASIDGSPSEAVSSGIDTRR
jgi:hypothetical protein